MAVFSSSDLSKLFGVPLVFLSKPPFKLNIKIKGSKMQCDLLPNIVKYFSSKLKNSYAILETFTAYD